MNRWFTDHLAFEILRWFPDINVDNAYTGVGLHGVFDAKYERILLTKLDYIPRNNNITYDKDTNQFYLEVSADEDAVMSSIEDISGIIDTSSGSSSSDTIILYDYGTSAGERITGIHAGSFGQRSLTDNYLYICIKSGDTGTAIWKKIPLLKTP